MATRLHAPLARPAVTSSRVVSYEDVVERAIRMFVAEGSLSVPRLADALAISRATLYRVITDQDRLLGDVLWVLTARTMAIVEREATGTGIDRVVDIGHRFHAMVKEFAPLRRFTETEPDRAFRVLFTATTGLHDRSVQRWAGIFRAAEDAGELELPFDAGQFSEMYVRLGESMLWSDLLGHNPVDVDLWADVQRSLFTLRLDKRA